MAPTKKIGLKSSDGEIFEVDEMVAIQSQTINQMIQDGYAYIFIPIPNVSSEILAKVIEYGKKHVESRASDELKAWDAEFVKLDQPTLIGLIQAANYLDISSLVDLTQEAVADMYKGKTTEELRKTLNIENDLTPEEEEEARRENQWAFE